MKQIFEWIPVIEERFPGDDRLVLLSFDNLALPEIGIFRDGAFYGEDDDRPLVSYGIFVNAWAELPKRYEEED